MSPPFRLAIPIPTPLPGIDSSANALVSALQRRRNGRNPSEQKTVQIIGYVLAALVGLVVLVILFRFFYIRRRRAAHNYHPAHRDDDSPTTRQINRHNQDNLEDALTEAQARDGSGQAVNGDAGVDRTTSVRSVMTLPVYRPKATENEQVIGVEGERDGIDVVVEMPTAELEEALRDEEMEALYRIRAARRRQIADREERRRLRREAREANDVVALRELRDRARERANQNVAEIEALRQEHERIRETRQRAVSSVSYADLGIARADGTRIRANSTESTERIGLLSDAASMDGSSLFQRRDRSASASLSIDTARSLHRSESPALTVGGGASPYTLVTGGGRTPNRSRASSAATTPRAGSSPEMIDAEDAASADLGLGGAGFPPPPGYDEVSLGELTPMHSRRNSIVSAVSALSGGASRSASPYPEPPPEYPGPSPVPSPGLSPGGPAQTRNNRLSAHMEDLAAQVQTQTRAEEQLGSSRTRPQGGVPRLPSLRMHQVPQIVIEPSSARP